MFGLITHGHDPELEVDVAGTDYLSPERGKYYDGVIEKPSFFASRAV
jgi:hypothetical protein